MMKLTMSIVGTLSGLSIFLIFLIQYHNYNASVWGFVTGILSFCVFHLNYLYLKNKIDEWYEPKALEKLKIMGLVIGLSSVVAFGVYLSLFITRKQDMFSMNDFNYFPCIIFSILSFKSGILLFSTARHYKKYVILCNPQFIYDIRKQSDSQPELQH
ncbi:unnamed protein product [Medioppia subpectinata]|uniref:Uncharacterized protein n=1 Tax=Medioppia subpectinata TaxID=1979941 RepID=A0A7R9L6E5_9ACAR|nr:unnamed protein product [Medioppia subpectinata]CAG2116260.1 unnamed protein product [Medioppia subpectinata]